MWQMIQKCGIEHKNSNSNDILGFEHVYKWIQKLSNEKNMFKLSGKWEKIIHIRMQLRLGSEIFMTTSDSIVKSTEI